ncbi:hypothetical protein KKB44_05785 [Candidatus Micrarchaeota archaeon]|nr:hypothetical protein [Candidatus Micrarchaeota archaeon]
MQTIEASISFLFFVSITAYILSTTEPIPTNDSLYRIQLIEDVWRVLYLRGDFENLGSSTHIHLEDDLVLIGNETGLCIFIDGVFITNCRGGTQPHNITASLTKTAIYDGKPRTFTFSLGT